MVSIIRCMRWRLSTKTFVVHHVRTTTTLPPPPPTPQGSDRFARDHFLCVAVMDESSRRPRQVDGDGAAKRRRLRRLRSWWRHEQQTVAAVLATFQHHSAPRGPRTARTGGERETNHTATLRKMLPPRDGFCGTWWDICPRLLLMSLCRRWWTSCRTLSISSPHFRMILSRLSKCPRSCLSMSLCARPRALRSWWNSWWKYRRSYPTPRYSRLCLERPSRLFSRTRFKSV